MASDKKKEGVNQIASETKIKMEGKNFDSMSPGLKETQTQARDASSATNNRVPSTTDKEAARSKNFPT